MTVWVVAKSQGSQQEMKENKQSSGRAAFPSSILLKTLHFIANSHPEKGT